MKQILIAFSFLLSISSYSQNLDTVAKQSLTLRTKDYGWVIARQGNVSDSVIISIQQIILKKIRDTVEAYGREIAMDKQFKVDSIPAAMIVFIYAAFRTEDFGIVDNMGSTNAEKVLIQTRVKALTHPALQFYFTIIDNGMATEYIRKLREAWVRAKAIPSN